MVYGMMSQESSSHFFFKTCATHVPEKVFVSQISLAFKNLISEFFFYLRHPCSREGVGFADFGARLEVTAVNLVDNLG